MPFFSKRVSMLEVQNRALIKTARETAERIDKLERELRHERERQQAAQAREREHIDNLERELQLMNRELERLKAEREFYFKRADELEEHNRALTESATKYSLLGQKLERELTESATKYSLLGQKLERELTEAATKYQKLERELTETATKYSLWGQKLERELARIDPNGAPRRRFGAQCEE
jgi:chromosome segregation ATPase